MKYTVGHEAMSDPYHVGIIKEKLTRMLPTVLPDLTDELAVSVQEYIPTTGDGECLPCGSLTYSRSFHLRVHVCA